MSTISNASCQMYRTPRLSPRNNSDTARVFDAEGERLGPSYVGNLLRVRRNEGCVRTVRFLDQIVTPLAQTLSSSRLARFNRFIGSQRDHQVCYSRASGEQSVQGRRLHAGCLRLVCSRRSKSCWAKTGLDRILGLSRSDRQTAQTVSENGELRSSPSQLPECPQGGRCAQPNRADVLDTIGARGRYGNGRNIFGLRRRRGFRRFSEQFGAVRLPVEERESSPRCPVLHR
mmetsp:Transcript_27280/g.53641  ORF Transcript_27280/g.53641 Transcript_27280/m.53641 type:complete len:230 (-) Transcript_27280:9846-10535(-)